MEGLARALPGLRLAAARRLAGLRFKVEALKRGPPALKGAFSQGRAGASMHSTLRSAAQRWEWRDALGLRTAR